jgi:hypothetical protein
MEELCAKASDASKLRNEKAERQSILLIGGARGANMTTSKSPALWAAVAIVLVVCANAQMQNRDASSSASVQNFLLLDFANNGQSVNAIVGERIELTLWIVGGPKYGDPQISSSAIRLEDTALGLQPNMPPPPGGPVFIYIFEAITEGEAEIKIPVLNALDPETERMRGFSVTIRVGSRSGNHSLRANLRTDQENTEPWRNRSVNLDNPLVESFVPSLPNLTAVEVELLAVRPGPPTTGEISMTILNPKEKMMVASLWKTVSVEDCSHVLFLLPGGGLQVSPGQVYIIQLNGDVFGWKYVVGGYREGAASAPHGSNPPLPDTRSTFLFKTFGTN